MAEQTKTAAGRREFMQQTIDRINEAVLKKSKQARKNSKAQRAALERQFSMEKAQERAKKRVISKYRR
jgi:hypothetical protein